MEKWQWILLSGNMAWKVLLVPSQEFAEKLFCATVNAQTISAQAASVGITMLDLLEPGLLLK